MNRKLLALPSRRPESRFVHLPHASAMHGFGSPFRPAFFTEIYNN